MKTEEASTTLTNIFITSFPFIALGILFLLVSTPTYHQHSEILSIAVTIDILLVLPVVHYLLIRNTKIPNITVVPFLILCTIICHFVLPNEHHTYLNLFKTWILPIIELGVVSLIITKVVYIIRHYKRKKQCSPFDFFTVLKETCIEILPKPIVWPLVTEISIFYYGFIHWKKRRLKENEFSYHKESGSVTLLIALILIIGIETYVVHVALMTWSNTIAWIITGISIYTGVQILGF